MSPESSEQGPADHSHENRPLIDLILGGFLQFEPAPPPFEASDDFPQQSFAVIYRLISVWHLLSRWAILILSGYSDRQVYRALFHLERRRLVRSIGRIGAKIYVLGPANPEVPIPWVVGRHTFYSPIRGRFSTSALTTGNDVKVAEHPYYVAEAVAWIYSAIVATGWRCLVYPESVLRKILGWYSPSAPVSDHARRWYATSVPDAVFHLGEASFRLELQLSRVPPADYVAVGKDPSHILPILYVTPHDAIFKAIDKAAKKLPRIRVIKLHDDAGLKTWLEHLKKSQSESAIHDPSLEPYGSIEFQDLFKQ